MIDFALSRASSPAEASEQAAKSKTVQQGAQVRYVAGGTTLIDLMKLDVETPVRVVDINRLELARTERQPDGSLRIGAMVRNADLAHDPNVVRDYPVLSQALLSGATGQLRNMATTGGNLLQRTRVRNATSARRARVAPRSADTIARTPFWARASTALPPILPTWRWP
jgi:xanthine dehydrogenase YagS FAD-binding subunit